MNPKAEWSEYDIWRIVGVRRTNWESIERINRRRNKKIKAYENNKENVINVKDEIINNELKKYENYIRNRRKKKFLVSQNNSREKRKYTKRDIEEDYQDIFLIDCLCLDKWEEKNNKFHKKSKSEFKGKKITLNQWLNFVWVK